MIGPAREAKTSCHRASEDAVPVRTTLTELLSTMRLVLGDLKSAKTQEQLHAALHDHSKLPDRETSELASQALDLLHEAEQILDPGPLVLADLFLGYMDSKCLVAAVELNVPDVLRDQPLSLQDLAAKCKARPDRLRQIMRVLYNKKIFAFEPSTGLYRNTSTSELLLSDHWTQWRNWVDLYGNEFYDMAKAIPRQVREGETRMAGQIQFGTDKSMFQWFSDSGQLARVHRTLSGGAIAQAPGIVADYPWHEISDKTLIDIGGGQGGLVAAVLRHYPNMKAGILDMEPVIRRAKENFHSPDGEYADVGSRISPDLLVIGNFLESVPESEVYSMKWCLHDWNDKDVLTILRNIRRSIIRGPQSRLIVFESLLADGHSSRLTRYGDITMMISANGQERDEVEWNALAKQTGWTINNIYHLRNAWPSAIEFVPVWVQLGAETCTLEKSSGSFCAIASSGEGRSAKARNEGATAVSSNGHITDHMNCITTDSSHKGETVISEVSFLEKWSASKGSPFYRSAAATGLPTLNFAWEPHQIPIHDARPIRSRFSMHLNGFEYLTDPAGGVSATLLSQLRSNDKHEIASAYYPRIRSLLQSRTGCSRVLIFDSTVRRRDPDLSKGSNPDGREQPATTVHCDQSARGARQRLAQNLEGGKEAAEEMLLLSKGGRMQLVNVWRPLVGPVLDWPLATMDWATLRPEHAHDVDLWRGEWEDRGSTMTFEYHQDQRWWFLSGQQTDEVTLIKIWDSWGGDASAGDVGDASAAGIIDAADGTRASSASGADIIAKCCPHVAFSHPNTPADVQPRESIEVRCFLIYDPPGHG